MSFIEVRNVWKEYGEAIILERVNARIEAGEFVTIVGTSGCGKTTFLNMLLGTETPTRGSINLAGTPLPDEPGADRGIVFQKYSVFPHLTVLQNLILAREFEQAPLFGRLFGAARRQAADQAREMLSLVGLSHNLDHYPHQLSGGMQQRLAIAQALMKQPKVLLLDEPFGALDPGIRADMHQLILSIWRRTRVNIFMITHDLKEGFYLGTRLWVFDKTRVDPQAPHAFGSTITYDLPVDKADRATFNEIHETLSQETPTTAGPAAKTG